eukprot:CAMPEP_0175483432 /NCGR_PEP_ID=MMETSP0095-20121207/79483_1 /TAXON_ID=311494 /ORGANISM="Alexandrium monilatum, Strain CCMP3105" /LENGTH=667 /DNA_ID=CAMNT_0016785137 /DNA_START=59 /DNA_END=2060 /DNA_ORIENTATION=+
MRRETEVPVMQSPLSIIRERTAAASQSGRVERIEHAAGDAAKDGAGSACAAASGARGIADGGAEGADRDAAAKHNAGAAKGLALSDASGCSFRVGSRGRASAAPSFAFPASSVVPSLTPSPPTPWAMPCVVSLLLQPLVVIVVVLLLLEGLQRHIQHPLQAVFVGVLLTIAPIFSLVSVVVFEIDSFGFNPHHLPLINLSCLEAHGHVRRPNDDSLPLAWNAVSDVSHEAADGVVVALRQLHPDSEADIVNVEGGAHGEPAIAEVLDLVVPPPLAALQLVPLHVRIVDLPDDLLEDVLERHQAGGPAILVHTHRDRSLLQGLQQVEDSHRLRNEERPVVDLIDREPLPVILVQVPYPAQQRLHADDADDVVEPVLVHGQPAVLRLREGVMQAGDRLGGVYADHVHEGDHDVAHPLGVQLADAADHLPLLGLQDARPHGGLQHEVELLLRHVGRLRSVYGDAKHAEEDLDDPVELPADRVNDLGDPEVPWQGDAGKLVGVAHRDALRDNLAEDQLQDGDRHGGDRQAAPSEELRADLCDEGRAEHAREGRPNEDRLHEPLDVRAQRRPHAQPPAPGLLRPLYLPLRQLPDLPGPEGRDRSLRAGAAAEYEEEEAPQREVHGEGAADGLVVHHPEGEAAGEAPGRDPPGHARRPDRRPQQRPAAGHEAG